MVSLWGYFFPALVQRGEPHFSLIYKVSDSALFISTALSIAAYGGKGTSGGLERG